MDQYFGSVEQELDGGHAGRILAPQRHGQDPSTGRYLEELDRHGSILINIPSDCQVVPVGAQLEHHRFAIRASKDVRLPGSVHVPQYDLLKGRSQRIGARVVTVAARAPAPRRVAGVAARKLMLLGLGQVQPVAVGRRLAARRLVYRPAGGSFPEQDRATAVRHHVFPLGRKRDLGATAIVQLAGVADHLQQATGADFPQARGLIGGCREGVAPIRA